MDARIAHEFDGGFTWVVEEQMERASHALVVEGRVWLIDPVEWAPALERAAALGEPAGVLQLLDRHPRGCGALAERLGVPFHKLPADGGIAGTPFAVRRLVDRRWWRESTLWWPERELLVVPEAVGTASYFALGRPLGVHPFLRLTPPYSLRQFAPRSILVGHGPSLHADAATALHQALEHSRGDVVRGAKLLPSAIGRALR